MPRRLPLAVSAVSSFVPVWVRREPVSSPRHLKRREHRAQAARQRQVLDAMDKVLRRAGRDAVAVLAEQGPDEGDIARARPGNGVSDQQAAPHVPLGVGEPMGGAVAPSRHASAIARASRRSVLTLRERVAYMGAKFGSATMTSWTRASRQTGHPFAVGRGLNQDLGAMRWATGKGPRTGRVRDPSPLVGRSWHVWPWPAREPQARPCGRNRPRSTTWFKAGAGTVYAPHSVISQLGPRLFGYVTAGRGSTHGRGPRPDGLMLPSL